MLAKMEFNFNIYLILFHCVSTCYCVSPFSNGISFHPTKSADKPSTSLSSLNEKEYQLMHNLIGLPSSEKDAHDFMEKHGSVIFESAPTAEIFVTKGDTEDTTPLTPDSNGDIVITEDMVHFNETMYNHVVLACNASYPVEWVYENGDGAPRLYTTQIRTFTNFKDPMTYGHSNIVVLFQERWNEQQTGSYFCQSVHKPKELRVGFHLFFTGEFGFPTMDNRIVEPEDKDSPVILPCSTTNPLAKIELHKIISGGAPGSTVNLTDNPLIPFDPRHGFLLRPSDLGPGVWGSYKCKINGMDSGWKIDLLQPKIDVVRVYPHTTHIHMPSPFSNHTFMCKSTSPLLITFPQTPSLGTTHYLHSPQDPFPYIAVLRISPSIPLPTSTTPYFKIHCISKSTLRLLHSWEYSALGPESLQISFDKSTKRLLCCSSSGLSPHQQLARCETDTDCTIKSTCFNTGRCDYAFPPKFVDAPRGCTAVDLTQDIPSHVVKCSIGQDDSTSPDNQVSTTVFLTSNVDNDDVIIYSRDALPPTPQILKIVSVTQQGNKVDIQCLASLFYFSTNLVFAYEKIDGSFHLVDEGAIQEINSYGPILHMTVTQDIQRVYCFAPLTRSVEWLNVSLPIITVTGSGTQPTQSSQSEPSPSPSSHYHQHHIFPNTSRLEGAATTIITETRVSTSSSFSTSKSSSGGKRRNMKISGRMRNRFSKKT